MQVVEEFCAVANQVRSFYSNTSSLFVLLSCYSSSNNQFSECLRVQGDSRK